MQIIFDERDQFTAQNKTITITITISIRTPTPITIPITNLTILALVSELPFFLRLHTLASRSCPAVSKGHVPLVGSNVANNMFGTSFRPHKRHAHTFIRNAADDAEVPVYVR